MLHTRGTTERLICKGFFFYFTNTKSSARVTSYCDIMKVSLQFAVFSLNNSKCNKNKNIILKHTLIPVGVNTVTLLFPVQIHYFNPCQIHICGSNVPCMASAEKTFIKNIAKEV